MKLGLLSVFIVLTLTSCSKDHGEQVMDEYLYRLSNVLDVDRVYFTYESTKLGRIPVANNKNESVVADKEKSAGPTISLLEFLSLYGCELQTVVGSNNAVLGKLAKPSQKLIYELKFLHFAPICLKALESEDKPELVAKLNQVIVEKRQVLPKKIWKAIGEGEEFRNFWKVPEQLGDYPDKFNQGAESAFVQLTDYAESWLNGDYKQGWDTLESQLFHINYGDGGYLLKSLAIYQQGLAQANQMVESQEPGLCIKGRPMFNQTAAENVVHQIFIGEIQAWASKLSQRYYELMPTIQKFEKLLAKEHAPVLLQWMNQRDAYLEFAVNSSKHHVTMLKLLLECGK